MFLLSLFQVLRFCAATSSSPTDMFASFVNWSIHLAGGRPGGRFHAVGGTEKASLLTSEFGGNLAMWPHSLCLARRIRTERGGWPVLVRSVAFETKSFHCRPRILRWERVSNTSSCRFNSPDSVQVAEPYVTTDSTRVL